VLTGKAVCVTGTRDPKLLAAIEAAGGTLKGVSRKVAYLVCQDPNSQSGKAKKARDYNATGKASIKIMSIEDFSTQVLGL